jgi:hypothetical protein
MDAKNGEAMLRDIYGDAQTDAYIARRRTIEGFIDFLRRIDDFGGEKVLKPLRPYPNRLLDCVA